MPEKRKTIWIALVCKNLQTTTRCLESAAQLARSQAETQVAFLLLDRSEPNDLDKWVNSHLQDFKSIVLDQKAIEALDKENIREYRIVNYDNRLESEQQDRMQISFAVKKHQEEIGESILWHVGERLIFSEAVLVNGKVGKRSRRNFFKEVRDFHAQYPEIDMALGSVSFAAPLPILLTLEKHMQDLLHPGKGNGSNYNPLSNCHDFYENLGRPDISLLGLRDFSYILGLCLRGIPVTRPLLPEPEDSVKTGPLEEFSGVGHLIVFNPEVLHSVPFFALRFRGRISLRTARIQAWLMQKAGYQVKALQLSLFHHRNLPGVDFEEIRSAYMADILGALTLRYLNGDHNLKPRLDQHREHLQRIQELISEAQHLYENSLLYSLEHIVNHSLLELENWTEEDLTEALERLQKSMENWVEKSKEEPELDEKGNEKPKSRIPDWLDFGGMGG